MTLREKAHRAVYYAVREGTLPKLDGTILCVECGAAPAEVYDHRDYAKPLDVAPVCKPCNWHRGHAKNWMPSTNVRVQLSQKTYQRLQREAERQVRSKTWLIGKYVKEGLDKREGARS